jgi:hypothetical protein
MGDADWSDFERYERRLLRKEQKREEEEARRRETMARLQQERRNREARAAARKKAAGQPSSMAKTSPSHQGIAPVAEHAPLPPVPVLVESSSLEFQDTALSEPDLKRYFLLENAALWWVSNQSDDLLCLPYCQLQRLDYQVRTALRVLGPLRGRALLSDEVGLGKTIEAGLVLKELLTRGMVKRFLVLTVPSLVDQWEEELSDKFGLTVATTTDDWPFLYIRPRTFPGGYVDWGEPVDVAAIRETYEETGLTVELAGLVGVYSYPAAPVAVVVYRARVLGGTITVCHENDRVEWVAPAAIPWEELAFPSTTAALRDFLAGR